MKWKKYTIETTTAAEDFMQHAYGAWYRGNRD